MKIYKVISTCTIILLFSKICLSQIVGEVLDTSHFLNQNRAMFFTNRPISVQKDSVITFKNKSTESTNTLHFCLFDFSNDSLLIKYKAENISGEFPTEPMGRNILYDMYENLRLKHGIKNFYFIVPGYSKTFRKQVYDYMKRLKENYGDSLLNKAAVITYAWATESEAFRYYRALRSSKRGAHDFAIFQHMLEEFLSDSTYFSTHPNDLTIEILFSSMGNQLFKKYLEQREQANWPLKKVYDNIIFVGSVAPRNSFEEGKAFHHLHQMSDTVDVIVNYKDMPLQLSSMLHFKNRMGNLGPKNEKDLPHYIRVHHIGKDLTKEDFAGLGHDYLLRNPLVKEKLLNSINQDIDEKEK